MLYLKPTFHRSPLWPSSGPRPRRSLKSWFLMQHWHGCSPEKISAHLCAVKYSNFIKLEVHLKSVNIWNFCVLSIDIGVNKFFRIHFSSLYKWMLCDPIFRFVFCLNTTIKIIFTFTVCNEFISFHSMAMCYMFQLIKHNEARRRNARGG
jgi:hypothetical protein